MHCFEAFLDHNQTCIFYQLLHIIVVPCQFCSRGVNNVENNKATLKTGSRCEGQVQSTNSTFEEIADCCGYGPADTPPLHSAVSDKQFLHGDYPVLT